MTSKKGDSKDNSLFSSSQSSVKTPKTKDPSKSSSPEKSPMATGTYLGKNNLNIPSRTETISPSVTARKKGPTTTVIVKYDVGFNNSVYLRGEGADLSWERGIMLKNTKADEWVWETNSSFTKCEFKVLINDRQYELGENHKLVCGTSFEYVPSFHKL